MGIFGLSRKVLNFSHFPFPHYPLSSLLFSSRTPQTRLLPNPSLPPILSFHQFHSNSSSHSLTGSISSSGSSSLFCTANPSSQTLNLYNFRWFRSFSVSSSVVYERRKQLYKIIRLIRRGENDLESKLDGMNVSLPPPYFCIIFRKLNCNRVSALRFFSWIRLRHPQIHQNTEICNLVIDNCGRLDDFDSMSSLLNDFRIHGIRLNEKAFGHLPAMISNEATKKFICKAVEVLDRIGGPSGVSGIHALIQMFSARGYYEMAEYVIVQTEKRLSNYSILIKSCCRRGDLGVAVDILDRMIKAGCNPNLQIFNNVLSSLCMKDKAAVAFQLLEKMQEYGCPPDAISFEIFINYSCRLGRLDMASKWLDRMISRGVEPRFMTHAALIKAYFKLQKYEEAHNYVVFYSEKQKEVSNMIYSLLADLHRKRGEAVIAQSILTEMIEKGLKPSFRVYMAVRKQLQNSGKEDLDENLERSFSIFNSQPS